MLSFIVRLARDFEQAHGFPPNQLLLNRQHAQHLINSFDSRYTFSAITELLQMNIFIDHDLIHPRVAWTELAAASLKRSSLNHGR